MSKLSKELAEIKKRIASVSVSNSVSEDDSLCENFRWHSSLGIDCILGNNKRLVKELPKDSEYVKRMFVAAGKRRDGGSVLVHKLRHCLWEMSDDNSFIRPVHASDILTLQDLEDDITTIETEA
ncbi:MAG: hypothetical protein M0P12_01045 [Paludibacteraceae bacterium]|nr:hypothetical protein [Paludibacteraceae bacterium]MCK9615202.1 hypothetical protein [Candidatus Omnitrophota bacterium]